MHVSYTPESGTPLDTLRFLHFYGNIKYEDVFGVKRITSSYYRITLIISQTDSYGHDIKIPGIDWIKGPEEYNQET